MRPVIKTAKRYFNADTATPKQLTIDSTKNQLKLFRRISVITDVAIE